MISPRYCSEDIEYLKIDGIKKIAYPMRCFCDINLQKLDYHMSWYGNYGIAFEKSWGMQNDIQPVHYLNENSTLRKDISDTFQRILKEDDKEETETQKMLKDYLLHELMFYKPYQGNFVNRNTNEKSRKCFCDECEWRYVPNVRGIGLQQTIPEYEIPNTGLLTTYYDMGVYIQVNADSITGGAGRKIKKFIGALLDEELIYCVGTDAHDKKHRPPKMKKAAAYVGKKCGEEYMRQIFYENAKEMVKRRGNRHHMEKT